MLVRHAPAISLEPSLLNHLSPSLLFLSLCLVSTVWVQHERGACTVSSVYGLALAPLWCCTQLQGLEILVCIVVWLVVCLEAYLPPYGLSASVWL